MNFTRHHVVRQVSTIAAVLNEEERSDEQKDTKNRLKTDASHSEDCLICFFVYIFCNLNSSKVSIDRVANYTSESDFSTLRQIGMEWREGRGK